MTTLVLIRKFQIDWFKIKEHASKNDGIRKDIKYEIKGHIETNENDNMTYQNF